ncbi:MAG: helix-turn-helix transcriptional regulator [Bacilli bacterium]|nr:helix-turn-helix transcriptional regulator [Bacilli bacterium]
MLGNEIKYYRTKKKMSQEILARKLNVTRQTISKWENNAYIPDDYYLIELSKILNINLESYINAITYKDIFGRELSNEIKKRRMAYFLESLFFSIIVIIFEIISYYYISKNIIILDILNNELLNFIITMIIKFIVIFIITLLVTNIIGESKIKRLKINS